MNVDELRSIGGCAVIRRIGEGGTAWVFEVQDPTFSDRHLALKLMKPEVGSTENFAQRFQREAALQARVNHPSLLTPFGYGRDAETGLVYYTMTLVDGPNLSQKVDAEGPLDAASLGAVYLPVLDALTALHESSPPIIHRDIKPSNILLTSGGHPYLADLGIAREQGHVGLTRTGWLVGSPLYMSPEQARGQPLDVRTDVFSMGLAMYQSLTGETVYDAIEDVDTTVDADIIGYLGNLTRNEDEIELQFPESVPRSIAEVIRRATRIKPANRPAGARALREVLAEALRAAELERLAGPRRRGLAVGSPRGVALGALLVVVVAAAAVAGVVAMRGPGEPRSGVEPPPRSPPASSPPAVAKEDEAQRVELAQKKRSDPVPQPPLQIASRRPARPSLSLYRNQTQRFSVGVDDPAGGELSYRWTMNGAPLPESGPSLDLAIDSRLPLAAKLDVQVVVSQGSREPARANWEISVANRRPRLDVLPSRRARSVRVGDPVSIEAEVADPDGDPVAVGIEHGGERVATSSLRFVPREPGLEKFRVTASDGRETVAENLEIRVLPREAASPGPAISTPPVSGPDEPTASALPPEPIEEPKPDPGPPRGPWQDAFAGQILALLEQALHRCDTRRLRELSAGFAMSSFMDLCRGQSGVDLRYRVLPDRIEPKSDTRVDVGVEEVLEGQLRQRVFQFSYRSGAPWAVFYMSESR